MAGITVLVDDVTQVADALEGVDAEFTAAARSLRDLTPEDVGPPDVAKAVTDVVARLERRLGGLAVEAGDGARAMRRHVADLPAAEPQPPIGDLTTRSESGSTGDSASGAVSEP
jgi:hypothetical protein